MRQNHEAVVRPIDWIVVIATFIFSSSTPLHAQSDPEFGQANLIYTPEEMSDFDSQVYIDEHLPELSSQGEIIAHWSGRTSVSPKVLITLLSLKIEQLGAGNVDVLLSDFSDAETLNKQIRDVAEQLSHTYYRLLNESQAEYKAIGSLFAKNQNPLDESTSQRDRFITAFFELFPEEMSSTAAPKSQLKQKVPDTLLQLPFPIGDSWETWGGTHTYAGNGQGPRSSLDFRRGRLGWGADTSRIWVVSATSGRVIKHSSCFVEVIGSNGWSTTYYHLDNVRVSTNQRVGANTRLANYANNLNQSICNGGMSNGPHVHFSLKRNGVYVTLGDVKLSGYRVNDGRRDYDTDCNFFWLDNGGSKICNGRAFRNNGVPATEIDRPDLTVTDISVDLSEVRTGRDIAVETTISNTGNLDSAATEVRVVASNDRGISLGDQSLGSAVVSPLAVGNNESFSLITQAPATPGEFWIGVCVIPVNLESVTSNNCSQGMSLTVKESPPISGSLLLLLQDEQ